MNVDERGFRGLILMAAVVIVLAGLKAAAPLLEPILAAAFVAILVLPLLAFLERRGTPDWLTAVLISGGVLVVLGSVSWIIGASVSSFMADMPRYEARVAEFREFGIALIRQQGIDISVESQSNFTQDVNPTEVLRVAGRSIGTLGAVLGNFAFAVLLVVFMVAEAASVPEKMRSMMGDSQADLSRWSEIIDAVNQYSWIKTQVNLLTGVVTALVCWLCGVQYPLLWGLLGFLLNYIPAFGGFIALVPPVLLALLDQGVVPAIVVASVVGALNAVLGNVVEPKLMGQSLGMSPLVVLLSLLFWGWLWGPIGMLLAVPLTMVVKVALEHTEDLRWVAIMLGTRGEAVAHTSARASRSLVSGKIASGQSAGASATDLGRSGSHSTSGQGQPHDP